MGMQEKVLPAVLFGTGFGAFGYVIGGIAAPYVAGVNALVYAALFFVLAAAYTLNSE